MAGRKRKTGENGEVCDQVVRANITRTEFELLDAIMTLKQTNFSDYLRKLILKDFASFKEQ